MYFKGIDVTDGLAKKIRTENGVITEISPLKERGCDEIYLSNTFVDMQVNGYKGIDYSGEDLTEEGILYLIDTLAKFGTFRHVPTIITNSEERIERNLKIISELTRKNKKAEEAIVGIHIEGPFISGQNGPRGAHDSLYVRKPNIDEALRWQKVANGLIKIITIAPEIDGAEEFTRVITKKGIHVAIGHCEPNKEQINKIIEAGSKLSTHLGNGSSSMLPRLKNHIWEQVADDRLNAGIICDGFHLPPSVVKTFYRTKGISRLILVSDVALLGGKQPGFAKWGNVDVEICSDGHLNLAGTTLLAGAGHLLDWDIVRFMEFTGTTISEAIKTVTNNPLALLGKRASNGFAIGENADVMEFTVNRDRIKINKANFYDLEIEGDE